MNKIKQIINIIDKIDRYYIEHWWIIVSSCVLSYAILWLGTIDTNYLYLQIIPSLVMLPAAVFLIYLFLRLFIYNPIHYICKLFKK